MDIRKLIVSLITRTIILMLSFNLKDWSQSLKCEKGYGLLQIMQPTNKTMYHVSYVKNSEQNDITQQNDLRNAKMSESCDRPWCIC